METDEIQEFYRLCEFYILRNIELSTGFPTNTKLQNNFRYLLIYLDLTGNNAAIELERNRKIANYLETCAYEDTFIAEIIRRSSPQEKLLELLDYCESYVVDEVEKDMYGHGDKCYTALFDQLELFIKIKQEKYSYGFTSVHDLLVNGYYFDEKIADKFDQLAASHTPEECPD